MDLFQYDYDELALRVQQRLDRLAINFLRNHRARVLLDDVDFHGIERVDLELKHDGHHLIIKQSGVAEGREVKVDEELVPETFESSFDGRPASEVSAGLIAQWLALLPAGEIQAEAPTAAVDPTNPFLSEKKQRDQAQAPNPFLTESPRQSASTNPFAPDDDNQKRRSALDWLKSDD